MAYRRFLCRRYRFGRLQLLLPTREPGRAASRIAVVHHSALLLRLPQRGRWRRQPLFGPAWRRVRARTPRDLRESCAQIARAPDAAARRAPALAARGRRTDWLAR